MLRLSKLTDYAVVVLIRLGECDREGRALDGAPCVQTSPGLSAGTGVPEPTVAKVLKSLATAGLVSSHRGARGGYRLVRPLEAISVADVIAAVDGPIALTACVDGSTACCDVSSVCAVKGRWDLVNEAMLRSLHAISLADMRQASVPTAFRVPASALPAPSLPASGLTVAAPAAE
jgi:FeS assembly SUF system regulator